MYRHLAPVALIAGLLLFSVSVQAYGGDGTVDVSGKPAPTTGVCNDDQDNDDDNLIDRTDTGCTKVYQYDRSEYDMRDSDLTYQLYGGEGPDTTDLSVSYPGFVERSLGLRIEDCDPESGYCSYNEVVGNDPLVVERWIDSFGYPQWAGGELKSTGVQKYDASITDYVDREDAERDMSGRAAVNNPLQGAIFSNPEVETCGNGDRNMNEGKNVGCPEDWGFLDDLTVDGETRTAQQSSNDITDELKDSFTVDVGINHGAPVEQSDPPTYEMDLLGLEAGGEDTINIQSPEGRPRTEELYEHDGISAAPDFFADGREIKVVYPYASETTYTQVSDVDLVESSITHYTQTGFRVPTSCDFGGTDGTNVSCQSTGNSYCLTSDVVTNSVRNYSIASDTREVQIPTKAYRTEATDDPLNNPGYVEDITDRGFTVNVERDIETGWGTHPANNCPTTTDEMECDFEEGDSDPCSPSDYEYIWTDSAPDYDGDGEGGDSYTSTVTHDTDIVYEDIEFREKAVFSTVYEDNQNLPSEASSKEALFNGHYNLDNIVYNGPYYSPETNYLNDDFANSPAVSSSSFEVTVQDGTFHSKRDYYGVFDVDGTNGFGDSFIAVKEGSKTQSIPAFNKETAIVSPSGEKVGNDEGFMEAQETNFVDVSEYSPPGQCPDGIIFCVAAVDLSVKEWSDWDSPTQPESEFETIDTIHVNESFGACRKYQELIGGAHQSILRCQYDYGEDFPNEPVPFHKPNVVGGDGS
ncbi:hypothetical protein ACK3SF_02495 [Candidatus Nanosalina sp. VS9-1]|uniref:hypothetical protein n=1 Tax=Candidatus Nanosalina sp. VS9-1 TaxID=3388566 RepID=UPI0039E14081